MQQRKAPSFQARPHRPRRRKIRPVKMFPHHQARQQKQILLRASPARRPRLTVHPLRARQQKVRQQKIFQLKVYQLKVHPLRASPARHRLPKASPLRRRLCRIRPTQQHRPKTSPARRHRLCRIHLTPQHRLRSSPPLPNRLTKTMFKLPPCSAPSMPQPKMV